MEDYPVELRRHPVPVVALVGNHSIQEKFKEAITREGKSSLKVLQYDFGDSIPVLRPPKRVSYDSYVPRVRFPLLHPPIPLLPLLISLFTSISISFYKSFIIFIQTKVNSCGLN